MLGRGQLRNPLLTKRHARTQACLLPLRKVAVIQGSLAEICLRISAHLVRGPVGQRQ